jgi:hypothetical protein
MKFLALEVENYTVKWNEVEPALLKEEARRVFDLEQEDLIRNIYFRADTRSAVIEWEADSLEIVTALLSEFPLVKSGFIHFEILPLVPYTGFNRLFG